MRRPKFDTTIDLGHVLTVVIILFGMWGGFVNMRDDFHDRLTAIETKLAPLWESYTRSRDVRIADRKHP